MKTMKNTEHSEIPKIPQNVNISKHSQQHENSKKENNENL